VDKGEGGLSDIQVFDANINPTKPGVRVVGTLPASPRVINELLWDIEFRRKIEKEAISIDLVEKITDDVVVVKTRYAAPFPVTAREVVCVCHTFERDGTYYNVAFSINHKGAKPDKNYVRAVFNVGLIVCQPNPDGTTAYTRISQLDPKGNIPTFVLGLTKTKAAEFMVALRHALFGLKP